jgi:hypothetical protein
MEDSSAPTNDDPVVSTEAIASVSSGAIDVSMTDTIDPSLLGEGPVVPVPPAAIDAPKAQASLSSASKDDADLPSRSEPVGTTSMNQEGAKSTTSLTENGDSKPTIAISERPINGDGDVFMMDAHDGQLLLDDEEGASSRRRSTRVRQVVFQPEPPVLSKDTKNRKKEQVTKKLIKEQAKENEAKAKADMPKDVSFSEEDPNLGRFVEQSKVLPTTGAYYPLLGQIVGCHPPLERIPPRYTIQWQPPGINNSSASGGGGPDMTDMMVETKHVLRDDWVADDVKCFFESVTNGSNPVSNYNHHKAPHQQTLPGPLKLSMERIKERYEQCVERDVMESTPPLITTLILVAAFEEALQCGLQYQQQKQQEAADAAAAEAARVPATATKKSRSSLTPHPPLYYTTNPTHYLQPPSQDRLEELEQQKRKQDEHPKAQMTPASLAQRVRQGCQWAYNYLESNQPTAPVLDVPLSASLANSSIIQDPEEDDVSSSVAGRRSSRAAVRTMFDPTPTPSFARGSRSSAARAVNPGVPEPNPVQKGGRVALWWLHALENGTVPDGSWGGDDGNDNDDDDDDENNVVEKVSNSNDTKDAIENGHRVDVSTKSSVTRMDADSSTGLEPVVPDTVTKVGSSTAIVGGGTKGKKEPSSKTQYYDDDEEEHDDEPDDTKDDDEEYGAEDAKEDEDDGSEELEDVEKERGKLSPVSDPAKDDDADVQSDENEHDDDVDDNEEEDEEHAIVWENSYLKPPFPALLEYLSRNKSITLEDVQKAMSDIVLRVRNNKRTSDFGLSIKKLDTFDQIVLDLENPHHPSKGKVVLKCVSGENFGELQRLDAAAFGRCKFELEVVGNSEKAVQVIRKEDLMQKEIEYKERKSWDRWRYKGIMEGYSVWPSWHDAAESWVRENAVVESNLVGMTPGPLAAEVTAADVAQDTNHDEALAKSLEETEPSGRRRNTRRGGGMGTDGVFYGNQSQLTQKQLVDALLRLVKSTAPQSLVKLQSMVADDSSDPLRRCRIALGKMIWKRNMLKRKAVECDTSDKEVFDAICSENHLVTHSSLLPVPKEETNGVTLEMRDLLDYLRSLHDTEVRVRRLVLRQLQDVPIAIVAAAADDRPGSLENLDGADFEDESSVEWRTSGNPLIGKAIFRPPFQCAVATDMMPCNWYTIRDYTESIKSDADDAENDAVERRMRFRAMPSKGPKGEKHDGDVLILTEAQVHAGARAGEMHLEQQTTKSSRGNPFSRASGDRVTLIPIDDGEERTGLEPPREIQCRIVGHDNIVDADDDSEIEYRILVLPEPFKADGAEEEPFWAVLDIRMDDSSYVCQPMGGSTIWYSIENQDYHPNSAAYKACVNVLDWLRRQNKALPFSEPVDPVALNIPSYFQIVKKPMDISTISNKLENGSYSSIPHGQSLGRTPIARMLNGPFRKDIELMFDNAMLFNPPDDWIYQAAAALKKNALKKIADATFSADKNSAGVERQRKSVYVDEDSDVDMYEYESDNDDDFGTSRRKSRKRKSDARSAGNKDESAAKAIEHPVRLQHCLKDGNDLRGPFANLRVNTDANSFTMAPGWTCRKAEEVSNEYSSLGRGEASCEEDDDVVSNIIPMKKRHVAEMTELLALQFALNENDSANLRRSSRAPIERGPGNKKASSSSRKDSGIEYIYHTVVGNITPSEGSMAILPTSRLDVEVLREKRHEEYYSKLYQQHEKELKCVDIYGAYVNSSFPPYLGRVVPTGANNECVWELRSPFVIPALRWVIRGLIQSGHLTAIEPMTVDPSSGVILTNDIYYWDSRLQPYEVLDVRELQRRKRADNAGDEESEDDVELSEYEKLRAERVARNADRLKALGLA